MAHSENYYEKYIRLITSLSQYELPVPDQKDRSERNEIDIEMHSCGQQLEEDGYESINTVFGGITPGTSSIRGATQNTLKCENNTS